MTRAPAGPPSSSLPRALRNLEACLIALALIVSGVGFALLRFGRPAPPEPLVNINAVSAVEVNRLLKRADDAPLPPRPISDVDALVRGNASTKDAPDPGTWRTVRESLSVRSAGEAERSLAIALGALSLAGIVSHLILRQIRPNADPVLLPTAALLGLCGVMLLYGLKDPMRDRLTFLAQASGCGLALVAGAIGASRRLWRLPLHRYGYLYALAAVALLAVLAVFGRGPGGVRLAVAGFQPVELVKVLLVFFLAAYLSERGPALSEGGARLRRSDLLPMAGMYLLPLGLFALLKDLGPALILFGSFVALLFAATNRRRYVAAGLLMVLVCGALGNALHIGTFPARVAMWRSPWNNAVVGGDQTATGLWGIASGGPQGSGLGLSGAARMPRSGSDLAFCSWAEETGVVGGLLALFAFAALVVRGAQIARRAASDFERLLAAGLASLLGLQTILILGGNLGLLPLSGVALPLLSYGKSSLIVTGFIVGLLLALSDRAGANQAPRAALQALRRLEMSLATTLVLVCGLRFVFVQTVAADRIAMGQARSPDADKVVRPHANPRLLALVRNVPRGRILDRNGDILAETVDGVRRYPLGAAAGHLVGWTDPRYGGPTFAERQYDGDLRGYGDTVGLLRLWRTKDLPGFQLPVGKDVRLSIDADLQRRAYDALVDVAHTVPDRRTRRPKRRGAAVVLEVGTGKVLAAVTAPGISPEAFTPKSYAALSRDPDRPAVNRAVDGSYPPGSTFKLVTAAAVLERRKVPLEVVCRHIERNVVWQADGQHYARKRITDDESERGHGAVGLDDAFRESCNVYFARAGLALGADALLGVARRMGLELGDARTLAAALPEAAIGQGPVVVSPLDMARVAAIVGGQGGAVKATFRDDDRPEITEALSRGSAQHLVTLMRRVTESGTAAGRFDGLPFPVGGKTGTAQTRSGDGMSHSWFVGVAPAESPQIAFAAIVENGGYGARAAVPLVRKILEGGLPRRR